LAFIRKILIALCTVVTQMSLYSKG